MRAAVPPVGVDIGERGVAVQGLQYLLGTGGTDRAVVLFSRGALQPTATADVRGVFDREFEYLVNGGTEC